MFFPHRSISRVILVNSTLIWLSWLGLRLLALLAGFGFNTDLLSSLWIVVLTTGLAVFDVRRRSRHVMLENLGVSGVSVGVVAACPPILLESILLVVSRT